MNVTIITTGGTIDKIYFDAKNEFQVGDPQIGRMLEEANVTFNYEVKSVLRKDSLDLTDADRALIRSVAVSAETSNIIVTHGTDSMILTAQALIGIPDKTIVLVGSMQPANIRASDAIFNIGYAVATAQLKPPGIYIAMNGRVFNPLHALKNVPLNRFETNT